MSLCVFIEFANADCSRATRKINMASLLRCDAHNDAFAVATVYLLGIGVSVVEILNMYIKAKGWLESHSSNNIVPIVLFSKECVRLC